MRYRWLVEGEEVILDRRAHASALVGPGLRTLFVVGVLALLGFLYNPVEDTDAVDYAVSALAAVVVARFCFRAIRWWTTRLVLTDRRVVALSGVLARRISSLPLARVFDVTYKRSLAGRVLGYGSVTVESAAGAVSSFERVPDPDEFCGAVMGVLMSVPIRPTRAATLSLEDEDTGPLPRVIV